MKEISVSKGVFDRILKGKKFLAFEDGPIGIEKGDSALIIAPNGERIIKPINKIGIVNDHRWFIQWGE